MTERRPFAIGDRVIVTVWESPSNTVLTTHRITVHGEVFTESQAASGAFVLIDGHRVQRFVPFQHMAHESIVDRIAGLA